MKDNNIVFLTSNTSWYLYNFRKSTILELISSGYKPVCIAPKDAYSAKLIELGAKFYPINVEGKSTNIFKELLVIFQIFKIVKQNKPLFVYNFTIKMNIYVGLCCVILNVPYSNNVSGLGTAFLHKGFIFSFAKRFYGFINSFAKVVFFQNKDDLDLFVSAKLSDKNKSVLLPGSGVNVNEFFYKRPEIKKNLIFIMISRVIADKGVREYIEASEFVRNIYPETRFILVGDWLISNKSSFNESEIINWKETSCVEFVGHQDDVKSWIYNSDVIVLPSYREGMPRTILEAASCGRPSIVSDVPGCRHSIIHGETGWLCEVKSSKSLAEKMINCIELRPGELEKHGLLARVHIEDNFSDSIVVSKYINLLDTFRSD